MVLPPICRPLAQAVLVRVTSRPLQRLNSPYLLLGLALLLGQFLSLFISSATGLGLLLMATLYPLLTRLGCSRAAVAAVIASTCAVEFGPGSGNSVLAAKTAGIEVVNYFVQDQLPIVVPVILLSPCCILLCNAFRPSGKWRQCSSTDADINVV